MGVPFKVVAGAETGDGVGFSSDKTRLMNTPTTPKRVMRQKSEPLIVR